MEGAPGTLYEGEKFQLLFKFSSRYPFDSPQVSRTVCVGVCVWVNMRLLVFSAWKVQFTYRFVLGT